MFKINITSRSRPEGRKYLLIGGVLFAQSIGAGFFTQTFAETVVIDETMPAGIPEAIVADWKAQDGTNYTDAIARIKGSLPAKYAAKIVGSGEEEYRSACHWRRVARMYPYREEIKRMVYARHHDIGGASVGFTEDLNPDGFLGIGAWGMPGDGKSSDYPRGATNTALLKLTFDNYYPSPVPLIEDTRGVLRDPCLSWDGRHLIYAHSKDNNGYHLSEIDLTTRATRQLTADPEGLAVSDFEPCVLPSGDIIFNSSRCFGHVDVNTNITSNLFVCNSDGKYLRRIGYDQVHTFYPTLAENGLVMYSRWEYNDRNIATCCGIFTMNQDGGRQQEFYGNQTEWPAYIIQARAIPGNPMKTLAIISGNLGPYAGDLAIIDARRKRNGSEGVQLIAPKRTGGNSAGMEGVPDGDKLFQNPWPLDEEWFIISYRTRRNAKFQIFLMNTKGERELVTWDDNMSVSQPISLKVPTVPVITSTLVDYSKSTAEVSVADVYYGPAMEGVPKGTVEKIRVVALEYRTDPAFGFTGRQVHQMTPIGRFGCSWMAKWIVGEAKVAEDGSAAFIVPPNTPLFFQLIAKDGTCVQTMRSWTTLMPGERFDCTGCHEDKNAAPPGISPNAVTAKPLDPFFDVQQQAGSFHYPDIIQPVLDKNCVKSGCHDATHATLNLTGTRLWTNDLDDADNKNAFRYWNTSYYNLSDSKFVRCDALSGRAGAIPPRYSGSSPSPLITMLKNNHHDVNLTDEEMGKLCAWIDLSIPHSGTYTDDMKDEHREMYLERLQRRKKEESVETANIKAFVASGGYHVAPYNNFEDLSGRQPVTQGTVQRSGFKAHFNSVNRILIMRLPAAGTISLTDLTGRRVFSRTIFPETICAESRFTLPSNIAAGSYIVSFRGATTVDMQLISVF